MARLKLTLAYNGARYCGWQDNRNAGVPTIEGALRAALVELHGGKRGRYDTHIEVAGRTDAGVHAVGQVCHVEGVKEMPPVKYLDGLNRFLPPEIRIREACWVGEDFHARYGAESRTYRYLLYEGRQVRPDLAGRVGLVKKTLDIAAMQAAMDMAGTGRHDFTSLRDAECQSHDPVLEILQWRVWREDDALGEPLVVVEVTAARFLHHMVRNLLGVLVPIGLGKAEPRWLKDVLDARNRARAGVTFAPDGLYLLRITYKK